MKKQWKIRQNRKETSSLGKIKEQKGNLSKLTKAALEEKKER